MTLALFATALHLLTPLSWPVLPSSLVGGLLCGLVGCGVTLRAWWVFRERETAICPTEQATVLVSDDVYRMTRNPMYLGIVLILLGLAVATGGIYFYLGSLSFFLIIDYVFRPYEEAKLAAFFGDAYERYRKEVRRWL